MNLDGVGELNVEPTAPGAVGDPRPRRAGRACLLAATLAALGGLVFSGCGSSADSTHTDLRSADQGTDGGVSADAAAACPALASVSAEPLPSGHGAVVRWAGEEGSP